MGALTPEFHSERLNQETGQVERVKALRYTIKDGIIFDAQALLADVRNMVAGEKEAEARTNPSTTGA